MRREEEEEEEEGAGVSKKQSNKDVCVLINLHGGYESMTKTPVLQPVSKSGRALEWKRRRENRIASHRLITRARGRCAHRVTTSITTSLTTSVTATLLHWPPGREEYTRCPTCTRPRAGVAPRPSSLGWPRFVSPCVIARSSPRDARKGRWF